MMFKFILTVFLVGVCGGDSVPDGPVPYIFPTGPQDIEMGTFKAEDTVLTQFDIMEPTVLGNWFRMTIRYPPDGVKADETITYVKVTDKIRNGYNGVTSVTSGGVGQKTVTIEIKAKFSRPIDFSVLIKGKK